MFYSVSATDGSSFIINPAVKLIILRKKSKVLSIPYNKICEVSASYNQRLDPPHKNLTINFLCPRCANPEGLKIELEGVNYADCHVAKIKEMFID